MANNKGDWGNPEWVRAYQSAWRQKHVERYRAKDRAYYMANKDKWKAHEAKKYSDPRLYLGIKYKSMRSRVLGRTNRARIYKGFALMPKADFVAWSLADKSFLSLWDAWQGAGRPRKLSPSIDRIDTLRGYVPGNVQWLSMSVHMSKTCLWRDHGINPITKAAA
jgi:hypothetical protein